MQIRIGSRLIKSNSKEYIPFVYALLIMIALTVYHTWKMQALFYLGLALMFVAVVIMPVNKLIQLCFLLAPNIMAIKFTSESSALFGYFFVLVYVKYVLMKGSLRIRWIFVAFVCTILATAILRADYALILPAVRCFVFFAGVCSIFKEEWCRELPYRESLLRCYICGVALCVVCGFAYYGFAARNIFGGYFSGINNGRNFFSSLLSCGASLILVYLSHSTKENLLYKISFLLIIFAGVLSASRTFFVSLIFVIVLFFGILKSPRMFRLAFSLIILAGIACLLFYDEVISPFDHIFGRFELDDVTGANGRLEAWEFYIKKTFSSIDRAVFGNGRAIKYIDLGEIDIVEHNSLIELLSTSGLVGTVITTICFYHVYCAVMGRVKLSIIDFMPLCCAMICYFMLSAMFSDIFNFSFLISLIAAEYNCRMRGAA